jgi:uncharacterized protein (TIGR02001 family)
MKLIALSAAAFAAASAGAALADPQRAATPPTGPCAGVYVSVAGLSDYRFDGFSESDRHPTWQATLYCYRTDGWFAGTTLTGVDFEDTPRTRLEVDLYGGRQFTWRGAKVSLELLYTAFPDKRAPGPSYDILEPQVTVTRTVGHWTLEGLGAWELGGSGHSQEWHVRAGASFALTSWLSASGHVGRVFAARGGDVDYTHWDAGLTARWRRLSADLRYGGTDRSPAKCYFTKWCEPGLYGGLTWQVAP